MTKLRPLQDLSSFSLEGNPMASMEHSWQFVIFQLRSLKLLDGKEITEDDRQMADERFAQGEYGLFLALGQIFIPAEAAL